jgi:succinoglycan biosynthesis protein ExoA
LARSEQRPDRNGNPGRWTAAATRTPVSIIVPVFNDAGGLDRCCGAIHRQSERLAEIVEVLIVDGRSTDSTRLVAEQWVNRDPRFVLVDNPNRFVSHALNRAAAIARTDTFVWVSSHTQIDPDYTDAAVEALATSGADVVGGVMSAIGVSGFGVAVAWAMTSRLGVGGSPHHREGQGDQEADSAYQHVFTRATLERFGGYDETCTRNQDDEYTYRVRARGGRVWLSSRLRSRYETRGTPAGLWRQYFGYGKYKPLVLLRNPRAIRLRHLAPPAVAISWLLLPLARRNKLFAVTPAMHLSFITAGALAARPADQFLRRVSALLIMHLAYGTGFLRGLAGGLTRARRTTTDGDRPK